MKQPSEKDRKQKNKRKALHSLCSASALLLSGVCCIALIHVGLRIQELHRLISHSVTFCDQMEKQILGKVPRNYERWLVKTVDSLKGSWSKKSGKEQFYSNLLSLSANPHAHTVYFISCTSFCHLHPQIAKTRRGGRSGKVTAVITDNIIIVK